MQSVVTGQAPITLERKITYRYLRRKTIKTEDSVVYLVPDTPEYTTAVVEVHTITETNCIVYLQTKIER